LFWKWRVTVFRTYRGRLHGIYSPEFRVHQTWTYAIFKINDQENARPRTPGCVADSFVTSLRAVIFPRASWNILCFPLKKKKKIGARRRREEMYRRRKLHVRCDCESKTRGFVTLNNSLKRYNSRFSYATGHRCSLTHKRDRYFVKDISEMYPREDEEREGVHRNFW